MQVQFEKPYNDIYFPFPASGNNLQMEHLNVFENIKDPKAF
jgi:hypothetical protein